MGKIQLFGCLFLVKLGFTQPLRSFDVDSSFSGKQLILVNGIADYSASTMRNAILSPLIFGGFIDSTAKANSRHDKPFNTVGFEGNATYAHYFSIKDNDGFPGRWMLGPTVGTHYVGALKYTSDLYTLAFYGNEPFLGTYVDFSFSGASYYQFHTLGISLFDRISQSSVSVNLVGLTSYYKASLGGNDPMRFYYSEQGDSIYGICNGSFSQANSPAYLKGVGLSVSGDYRFKIINIDENGKSMSMQLSVSNLGVAYANQVKTQRLDTSFAFGGYSISQIVNREGLLAPGFSYADSLLTTESKPKLMLLPASIQIFNVVDVNAKARLQPSYGFKMLLISGYIPYVYAGVVTRILPKFHLGLCASYGGFSGVKLNTALHYRSNKYSLGIGSDNVIGLFSKNAFGKSLSIRMRCDI